MALIGKAIALQVWGLRLEWLFIIPVLGKWKQEDVWGSLPSQCNLTGQLQIKERLSWKKMDGLSEDDAQGCPLLVGWEEEHAHKRAHTHTLYIHIHIRIHIYTYIHTYMCDSCVTALFKFSMFKKREKNRQMDRQIYRNFLIFLIFLKTCLIFDLCAYTCVCVCIPFVCRCP